MSKSQRIQPGQYMTGDGRFEIRHDEAKREWFVAAKDGEAEAALRAQLTSAATEDFMTQSRGSSVPSIPTSATRVGGESPALRQCSRNDA